MRTWTLTTTTLLIASAAVAALPGASAELSCADDICASHETWTIQSCPKDEYGNDVEDDCTPLAAPFVADCHGVRPQCRL